MVSNDPSFVVSDQSWRSCGSTADAENQVVMARTIAAARRASADQRWGGSSSGWSSAAQPAAEPAKEGAPLNDLQGPAIPGDCSWLW